MPTKEEDFKERFIAVLRDLRENGKNDPEAMWLVGSLAARLIDGYKAKSWNDLKARLTPRDYAKLLSDFESEGNKHYREGRTKHAWAIQLLGCSLIARTQQDAEVRAGDGLLDEMLNTTVAIYRNASVSKAKAN